MQQSNGLNIKENKFESKRRKIHAGTSVSPLNEDVGNEIDILGDSDKESPLASKQKQLEKIKSAKGIE